MEHERGLAPVLLVTDDHELEHEVRRVAAGIAVAVSVVPDPAMALSSWAKASIVLVGGDCVGPLSRLRPSQRPGVTVVHPGLAPLEVYRGAVELRAGRVLELPTSEDWLVHALAESGAAEPAQGKVVSLLSAAGGSGGSTLAATVARLGSEHTTTALVDLDPGGIGIERLVGFEGTSVTTWSTLGARALGPRAFKDALPIHERVHLIGFGTSPPHEVEPQAAASVLAACAQAFGLTVLDVPRSLDAAARLALERSDLVVVICQQSVAAALAGQRLLGSLPPVGDAVVVSRAGPRTVDPVAIADTLGVPLLAEVGDQHGLDEALACGRGPLSSRGRGLRQAAAAVLDHLVVGP